MRHTFLLEAGRWGAHGRFFDARYRLQPVRGQLEVRHEALSWVLTGWLELSPSKQRLPVQCRLAPSQGGTSARWHWRHPGLGLLEGSLSLAGRRIFCSFGSSDGRHAGQATFTRQHEGRYRTDGELRQGNGIVCSWELDLSRPAP